MKYKRINIPIYPGTSPGDGKQPKWYVIIALIVMVAILTYLAANVI